MHDRPKIDKSPDVQQPASYEVSSLWGQVNILASYADNNQPSAGVG